MNKVWYDIEKLPSGGISYPENWKISITPYSFADVLNLTRAVETGIGAFEKILDGVKCSFDKGDLIPADILFLGIYRKLVSTKHSKIEFKAECDMCMHENKKVMDLKDLEFKEIKIPKLPIVVSLIDYNQEEETMVDLEFVPLTFAKYKEVIKKYKGDTSWLLAYSVQNMEPAEARKIIMATIGSDRDLLDEVATYLDFGLKPIEFACEEEFCDNILSVQLEDPTTVVFPFRSSKESAKNRIKFGNEQSVKRGRNDES